MDALKSYSTRDLLRMQKNFNATFVRKRDAGEDIAGLYRYLRSVENELARRRVSWYFLPRRRAAQPTSCHDGNDAQ